MKKSTKIGLIIGGIMLVALGFTAYWYWGIYLPKKKLTTAGTATTKLADLVITPTPPSPSTIKVAAPAPATT